MSRREQIRMTPEEISSLLDAARVLVCATNGSRGWPHLMPLWYVPSGDELLSWTYARSQKALNMQRDDRVTIQVEAGEQYDELRGVMIEATVELSHDPDQVTAVGLSLLERYAPQAVIEEAATQLVRAQAAKRVALRFVPHRTVSWDHRKLGGVY